MDTASISKVADTVRNVGKTVRDVVPYVPPSNDSLNTSLAFLFEQNSDKDRDALQGVKMDPAVLEAQVTVGTTSRSQESSRRDDHVVIARPKECSSKPHASFEEMLSKQQAALLSLTPAQFDILMKYVDTLRRQRLSNQINLECAFCKNNGEALSWYSSHALKDWRGRVLCPVLRAFRCPRCGATGDRAHTIKYCPESTDSDFWSRTIWP